MIYVNILSHAQNIIYYSYIKPNHLNPTTSKLSVQWSRRRVDDTHTHSLSLTLVYMKNRNMLMPVQNFLLKANRHWFCVYIASSVMYYRCMFILQWVVTVLSFSKSKIAFLLQQVDS